ncbi:MAG: hypothetical protein LBD91_05865, partial [Prevotellaceae bacterium]|nr:hypothetical protein [Prevotellaceae bacterium]
ATLTNPSATASGTVIAGSLNGRGFYLRGTLTPTFSSTVTVALSGLNAGEKFNWCAYVTDYPPNATEGAGHYELHGTTPFVVNGDTLGAGVRAYTGCITSLTDRTGCPGLIPVSPTIVSFIAQPDTICAGDTVTLTATATDATEYSFDDGLSWIALNAATFTTAASTNYIVKARNDALCETKNTAPVMVYPKPAPAFVNPPLIACAGSTVTLTAAGATLTAGSFPAGVSGAWAAATYTISGTPTATGTFTYTVTTTNHQGCANTSINGTITVLSGITHTSCTMPTLTLTGVGFTSAATYSVAGLILSSPVTVTTCNKTTYNGVLGSFSFNADCRSNSQDEYGHLFS